MKRVVSLVLALVLAAPLIVQASGGVLYMQPERGEFQIGDTFDVALLVDTDGAFVNASEAQLTFNTKALQVVSVSTDGSFLSSWATPPTYSNSDGTITLSGSASKDFSGNRGLLATVRFSAISNQPGSVHIVSGALLSMNGQASNIITAMRSGLFTLSPKNPVEAVGATSSAQIAAASSTAAAQPQVAGVSVQVPELSGYDEEIPVGERILLHGTAAPNSKVAVLLKYNDDVPVQSMILTTAEGVFTYVSLTQAKEGVYHAWAEARSSDGSESFTSDKVEISVRSNNFAAAASSVGSLLVLLLPFLLLLSVAGFSVGYVVYTRNPIH